MLLICLDCYTQYSSKGSGIVPSCPSCSCKYYYADPFGGVLASLYISLHKKGYCLEFIDIVIDPKGVYYFMVFFQTWLHRSRLQPLPTGFSISRHKYKSYDGPRMIKRFNSTDLQKCKNQVPGITRDLLVWSQGLPQLYKFTATFKTKSIKTASKIGNLLKRKYKFPDVANMYDQVYSVVVGVTTVFVKDDPSLVLKMEKLSSSSGCLLHVASE